MRSGSSSSMTIITEPQTTRCSSLRSIREVVEPKEELLGNTERRLDDGSFWSSGAVVDFEVPAYCWEKRRKSLERSLERTLQEVLPGRRDKGRPKRKKEEGVQLSLPFPADFSLQVDGFEIRVCQDLHQPKETPISGIAFFFPGCAGGIGPGRRPGLDYDEKALFPSASSALRTLDAPVDCYRLSWGLCSDRVGTTLSAIEVVRHALKKACRCASKGKHHEIKLFFIGHSFGGARALEASLLIPELLENNEWLPEGVDGQAVSVAGICSLNSESSAMASGSKRETAEALRPLVEARALVVAGDADDIVDSRVSRDLHSALPMADKELLVMPGGTHDLFTHKDQLVEKVVNFIVEGLN